MREVRVRSWKNGRGALGALRPLLGAWRHCEDSSLGPVSCERVFTSVLGGKFIELQADWRFPDKRFEETALFGRDRDNRLGFWSFSSDGDCSVGQLSEAPEVHPRSICFQAEMPAGLARLIYWPHETNGFWFAVEARSKSGWKRFLEQHFTASGR